MPHRIAGRGTYRLDRTFPGVGRIARATGTNKLKVFHSINAMLSHLWETGRLDVLRELRDGQRHPMVTWAEYRDTGAVARASSGPLVAAMTEWVEQARIGQDARYAYRAQVKRLARTFPHASVSELGSLLRQMRLTLPARSFGVLRTATLAYVRDTVGRRSSLYGDVVDVEPLKAVTGGGNPFTVDELARLDLAHPYLGMALTLFTTGMNPKEYFSGRWSVDGDGIRVHGTKREGRERVIPLLMEPVIPACQARWFRPKLKVAAPTHVMYDLRRGYLHLLEAAGIPHSRIRAYAGHGVRTVTDVYLKHNVLPYLGEDASRVLPLLLPLQRNQLTLATVVRA